MVFTIFVVVILVLALFVALSAIKTVPQGYEWTVERFGRYVRTLKPGITLLTPFYESVGRKVSVMEQVLDVVGVLQPERVVQAKLLAPRVDDGLQGVDAEGGPHGVARYQVDDQERRRDEHDDGDQELSQAAGREPRPRAGGQGRQP